MDEQANIKKSKGRLRGIAVLAFLLLGLAGCNQTTGTENRAISVNYTEVENETTAIVSRSSATISSDIATTVLSASTASVTACTTVAQTTRQTDGATTQAAISAQSKTQTTSQAIVKEPIERLEEQIFTEAIPFDTVEQYSDAYYEGETVTLQEGKEGVLTKKILTAYYDEKQFGQWETKTISENPINKIVVIGTRNPVSTEVTVETEEIRFETIIQTDANLYEDEQTVLCEGQNGMRTDTFRITYYKNTQTDKELLKSETVAPINKIIAVGTRNSVSTEVAVETEEIRFETIIQADANLYEDEQTVLCEGQNGMRTDTFRITYYKNTQTDKELLKSETVAPINKIIAVGTKPCYATETEISESALPFACRSIEDSTLPAGTSYIQTEGQNGKKTVSFQITFFKGVETERKITAEETVDPIDEVTVIGTYIKEEETFRLPYLCAGEEKEGYIGHAYSITQYYGNNGHGGLDIGVWYGNAVVAAMSGTVVMAYNEGDFDKNTDTSLLWTYGTFVVIEHENGIRTYYAHLRCRYVSVGEKVTQGQIIGQSGNTGRVSPAPTAAKPYAGTHLHFEVRVYDSTTGKWVRKNPLNYIPLS